MRSSPLVALAIAAAVVSGLSACAAGSVDDVPTASSSPVVTPSVAPTFSPQGTANDNIAFFRSVVESATKAHGLTVSTQQLAQTLVAKGFAAKGIEFTDNATAVGMKPDSVTIAAEFKGQCLIAQYGPSIKGLAITLAPVLASGGCLLGRSINHL